MAYQPISCAYYDELEARATLGRVCTIRYRDESGEEQETRGRIVNLFTRQKIEYLQLDSGFTLRLDRLVSVDGYRSWIIVEG